MIPKAGSSTFSRRVLIGMLLLTGAFVVVVLMNQVGSHTTAAADRKTAEPGADQLSPGLSNPLFELLIRPDLDLNNSIEDVRFEMTAPGEITFSFNGYANPQRPFPGYVGRFQLGPVRISGSGIVRASDGALLRGGAISHTDNLIAGTYRNHRTNWRVVRGLGVDSKDGVTELRLQIRVTSSNYTRICPVGTQGVLTLIDDNRTLSNRQTRDGIRMEAPNPAATAPDGGAACRTHVHGMNNENYSWTDPRFGGPRGGIFAVVNIKVEPPPVICNIVGRWRQTTPGVSTSIWTFTHLSGNRYRAVETGSGNATGTAVLTGNRLRLDASTRTLSGYYIWTIGPNCRIGNGRLVFTRGRRGTFTSSITMVDPPRGPGPTSGYTRYTNTGIDASFDLNYYFTNITLANCTAECDKHSWCRAFEYLPNRNHCYLYRTTTRKTKNGVETYIKR